jgi:hypothetical protein
MWMLILGILSNVLTNIRGIIDSVSFYYILIFQVYPNIMNLVSQIFLSIFVLATVTFTGGFYANNKWAIE